MDARRQTDLHQQQRAWRLAASTDVDTFASLLSRPDLLDCINMKWGQIYFSGCLIIQGWKINLSPFP
ncbi:hypothetical protein PT85_02295 [Pseudomonas flexibilis]|uniref:Uncharacterized protein n=1 Tax=Pseudomonas flexibilis TaxID=706570 RepID=A0A0B3BPJ9_9PSED|nr:hypothetical protein PT85_02295 [Pseudomonas flexibilis]